VDNQKLILAVFAGDSTRFNGIKPFGNESAGLLSAVGAGHDVSLRWIQGFFPCTPEAKDFTTFLSRSTVRFETIARLLLVMEVKRYAFTSLWCAYAAVASVIILAYFWRSSEHRPLVYA
jgi:hypothetical protein